MVFSKIKYLFQKNDFFLKKALIFYLMIILIECEIKIFPDHHSANDPNFRKSQVKTITNESFYYDLGYFTQKTEKYRSPKYGLNYRPIECHNMTEQPELIYKDNDNISFFGVPPKAIKDIYSTLSVNENLYEETKLFKNTITGINFECPSPIRAFHNENFEINFTIPMIADNSMKINVKLVSEDGRVNDTIGEIELTANKYENVTFFIFPQKKIIDNTSIMYFQFERDGDPLYELSIEGDPDLSIQFISEDSGNLILSNYRVTITDLQTITGTPFDINTMIRSKNGIPNNCTKDEDCFIGFMCSHFNCTPCHTSCTECYQDDSNPAGMNNCRECNVMSTTFKPHDGYCDIGYVDVSLFKDFEVKVKPDGQDFSDRETLGFWIFFTDTELSRKRDPDRKNDPNRRDLKEEPEPEDILHHIVLKNRFVITIIQRVRKLSVYCHVYENIFSRNTTDHVYFDQRVVTENNYIPKLDIKGRKRFFSPHRDYYLNFSVPSENQKLYMIGHNQVSDDEFEKTIDGHWVHISCAESFDHGLYYIKTVINGQTEYREDHLYHEPFLRTFEDGGDGKLISVDVVNDKYFKPIIYDDYVLHLQFLNFKYSLSKIYLRHLTLFKEYMPIKMQYMYFDYSGISNFYELLYYIPFTQLIYGNTYRIKGYSYENQEEDIILVLNSTNSEEIIGDISPPLNFVHLNLPPVNERYIEIDLLQNETAPLEKREKMKYVYDDNLAMCCETYLKTEDNLCGDSCIEFHRLTFPGVSDKSGYCDYSCQDSMSCLKDQYTGDELDYNKDFCTSLSNAYNLFYRCEDDRIDYYFQFSGFYNSSKMDFKIEKMYTYMIDFWYYDDYFLKELREKFFGSPSHEKHYVLHTNVIDLFFKIKPEELDDLKDNPRNSNDKKIPIGYAYDDHYIYFSLKEGTGGSRRIRFRHQEWNRIYIHSLYNRTVEKYIIRTCLNYYYYDLRGYEDLFGTCGPSLEILHPTIGGLENIIFCDKTCKDWEQK